MRSGTKPIQWLGDSRDRLRRFPQAARREVGYQLSLIQAGRSASDWKPIPVVGPGVIEIRVHAEGEYRVFYAAKFEDAVWVLHVFARKTRKASSLDVELGKKRYRELLERRK
ncbi:MAG: type II toxin-antitoxin system RelE/ParE family toxin [Bryobacteraceae bacterium]